MGGVQYLSVGNIRLFILNITVTDTMLNTKHVGSIVPRTPQYYRLIYYIILLYLMTMV